MHNSKKLYEKGIIKNRKMLTQTQYSNYKFTARMEHMKAFYAGIKALSFGDYGTFHINEEGLRVVVEYEKSLQSHLLIPSAYFKDFHLAESVDFSIKLGVLADCLSLFVGIECSLKLLYKGHGAPLVLILQPYDDEDISTECSIKTSYEEQHMDLFLDESSPTLNVVFFRGPDFVNIYNELEKAAEELQITISPQSPHFKMESVGVMQTECCVEISKNSDMIMLFKCTDMSSARYKNQLFRLSQKAILSASKVAIKTDKNGLLELHFLLLDDEREDIFMQFYLTPTVDDVE